MSSGNPFSKSAAQRQCNALFGHLMCARFEFDKNQRYGDHHAASCLEAYRAAQRFVADKIVEFEERHCEYLKANSKTLHDISLDERLNWWESRVKGWFVGAESYLAAEVKQRLDELFRSVARHSSDPLHNDDQRRDEI